MGDLEGKTMHTPPDLYIDGIPEYVPEKIAAVFRARVLGVVSEFMGQARLREARITVGTGLLQPQPQAKETRSSTGQPGDDPTTEERARRYEAQQPLFTFDQLVLAEDVLETLMAAVDVIRVERQVFDHWGLRKIEPFPRTALNFHGDPGTGKTLAAHAIAHQLDRPILVAGYAEIESAYHGEGPKNVKAIFHAAERDHAVLFIDEADSLLSRRLTNVTQGSEQAINSMRSQLLICLERFRGVVIFATNLVENYDRAFETRVRHVHFPLPDEPSRRRLWRVLLPPELPLAPGFSIEALASQTDGVCGRDMRNAIIDAAVRVARRGGAYIEQRDLLRSIEQIKAQRIQTQARQDQGRPLEPEEKTAVEAQLREELARRKQAGSVPVDPLNDGHTSSPA